MRCCRSSAAIQADSPFRTQTGVEEIDTKDAGLDVRYGSLADVSLDNRGRTDTEAEFLEFEQFQIGLEATSPVSSLAFSFARHGVKTRHADRELVGMELIFRFIVGGLIVSLFAVVGDVLKPRSFAGLFAAAPQLPSQLLD